METTSLTKSKLISLVPEEFLQISSLFERYIAIDKLLNYRLPVCSNDAQVIVGLSGGADSSVLCLFAGVFLSRIYPNITYLFTDTKAEPDSCYETLDKLEALLGIEIIRITPESGLFELIDQYNGFLPGTKSRYCTKSLKVQPLLDFMRSIDSKQGYINIAGIRYDESDRDGVQFQHQMENANAAYPFIDLKITKSMVFDILEKSISIPSTYDYRSRSGCFSCYFQRNQEIIGMLFHNPEEFAITESYEKLCDEDKSRWNNIPEPIGAGRPGLYPIPTFIDIRKKEKVPLPPIKKVKKLKESGVTDMFGFADINQDDLDYDDLFVAYALYVDERLGWFGGRDFTPGVYHQQFVSVSTSLTGINTVLANYYKFKKTTPMPYKKVSDMKLVIAHLRFPTGEIDTKPPSKESYTWKSNTSYKQLRHLAKNAQATLEYADLQNQVRDGLALLKSLEDSDDMDRWLDAEESLENAVSMYKKSPKRKGKVLWEGLFTPRMETEKEVQLQLDGISTKSDIKIARNNLEYDEVPMACIQCSI